MSSATERNDAELVVASLAGDRDAFGQIVARYQALICSLAYSATGSIRQSEDLAQETFINAWQHLGQLREASKLRSWLCGIARHRISRTFERDGREPSHGAEPLEVAHESPAPEPIPSEQAISREEQAILWRSLEKIPATYREPLILFYREHQSIERVAAALELSEDAIKQRLSRGRRLLQDQVAAFVEGALQQTAPRDAFTISVLGALPTLTIPAAMATTGVTAAKGSVAAKAAAAGTFAGAILGPVVGVFSGWLGRKVNLENAGSPREREFMTKVFRLVGALAGIFCLGIFSFVYLIVSDYPIHPVLLTAGLAGMAIGVGVSLLTLIVRANRTRKRIRLEEAAKLAPGTLPPIMPWRFRSFEYRSRWTLLGLPLVHVRMECVKDGKTLPAIGWIAIGNIAYGVAFAFGGLAVGAISIGGAAVGLLAIGGSGLGLFSFAGIAFGVWAAGGVAVGYMAFGGGAMGWLAAGGGSAVARDFAVGATAFARHANDAAAHAFTQNSFFFRSAGLFVRNGLMLIWLPVALVIWQLISLRRNKTAPHMHEPPAARGDHL